LSWPSDKWVSARTVTISTIFVHFGQNYFKTCVVIIT